MKTNIMKCEVDERKLQEEISKYEIMNNQKAYLMMNKETMDALTSVLIDGMNIFSEHYIPKDGKICVLKGNKCYVDNDLSFGEVEIR